MESDAQREHTDAACLRVGCSGVGGGKSDIIRAIAVVFDGVLAIAVVVEAGADVLAEIAAYSKLKGHIGGRLVFELEAIFIRGDIAGVAGIANFGGNDLATLFGDEEEVGTDTELSERSEDVGQLIAVVDTHKERNIEVVGGLAVTSVHILVAHIAADAVPLEIAVQIRRNLAESNVETIGNAIAKTEAEDSVLAGIEACHRNLVVQGIQRHVVVELSRGEVKIKVNRLLEVSELRFCAKTCGNESRQKA